MRALRRGSGADEAHALGFERGLGVAADVRAAFEWYHRAAAGGSVGARAVLSVLVTSDSV